jgi:hypothetical protein
MQPGGDSGVEGKRHSRCGTAARRDHFGLRDSTAAAGEDCCWRGRIGQGKAGGCATRFCGRQRLPAVSPDDRGDVPAYQSPPDVATAQQRIARGQIYRGRECSEDARPRPAVPHGGKGERLLRNGGVLATAEPEDALRADRLVTGSGEKGQTYLYWRGNQLFQLPVSYWTELREWVNSPDSSMGLRISSGRLFRAAWSATRHILRR